MQGKSLPIHPYGSMYRQLCRLRDVNEYRASLPQGPFEIATDDVFRPGRGCSNMTWPPARQRPPRRVILLSNGPERFYTVSEFDFYKGEN